MSNNTFDTNLLRMIAAESRLNIAMAGAKDMFGKSYFSLGFQEKAVIDNTVGSLVWGNYHLLTPELFAQTKTQGGVGFQPIQASQNKT